MISFRCVPMAKTYSANILQTNYVKIVAKGRVMFEYILNCSLVSQFNTFEYHK